MKIFKHPWDTDRYLEWSGILGISGKVKSGKTRVALEYGVTAYKDGHNVVFITNSRSENKLHLDMLERLKDWRGTSGKFITRAVGTGGQGKDLLQQIGAYSTQGNLLIIDQPDFSAAGMSIRSGFEAMQLARRTHDCSFVVTVAAATDGRRLPFPRDKMLLHLDVCMGLQWGNAQRGRARDSNSEWSLTDELTDSDEKTIRDVERALMGEKLLQIGTLKNRNAELPEMWTCVDIKTMEKVGEASVGEQR